MIALIDRPRMTPEEYLEFEKTSEIKYEYVNGEIYAMAGTGGFHNIISGNLYILLRSKLGNSGCRTYFADMKIRLNEGSKFFYPDLVVTCDERDQPTNSYTDFPKLIVEVLSPSTTSFDRGAKFGFYRSIPSLQEYILINTDKYLVECFRRQKEDIWLFQIYSGLEAIAEFPALDIDAPLNEIYESIIFPAKPEYATTDDHSATAPH